MAPALQRLNWLRATALITAGRWLQSQTNLGRFVWQFANTGATCWRLDTCGAFVGAICAGCRSNQGQILSGNRHRPAACLNGTQRVPGHRSSVQVYGCSAQFIWRCCTVHLASVPNWLAVCTSPFTRAEVPSGQRRLGDHSAIRGREVVCVDVHTSLGRRRRIDPRPRKTLSDARLEDERGGVVCLLEAQR